MKNLVSSLLFVGLMAFSFSAVANEPAAKEKTQVCAQDTTKCKKDCTQKCCKKPCDEKAKSEKKK
jgi:hypothetical protein